MDDAGNVVDGGAAAAAGAVATAAVVLLLHCVSVTLEPVRDNSEATQSESEAGHHACLAALESFDSLWAAWKADSYLKAAIAFEEFWQGEGRGAPADRLAALLAAQRREEGLHRVRQAPARGCALHALCLLALRGSLVG